MAFPQVSARTFEAIQNLDIGELAKCDKREVRVFLVSLTRMSLLNSGKLNFSFKYHQLAY